MNMIPQQPKHDAEKFIMSFHTSCNFTFVFLSTVHTECYYLLTDNSVYFQTTTVMEFCIIKLNSAYTYLLSKECLKY
jgi:hypothetical protein